MTAAATPAPLRAPFKWKAAPLVDSSGKVIDADAVRILEGWPEREITSWRNEDVRTLTGRKTSIVTLNHAVRADFDALWREWVKAGVLVHLNVVWSGGWVARYKRGLTPAAHDTNPRHLSNHASGHAFDICAGDYPLGYRPAPLDPIRQLTDIARAHRWHHGIDFARCDAMHFQHVESPFP